MAKSIPLTRGKFAIIDDCDYDEISKYKWHLNSNGYARRSYWENSQHKKIYMHQQVLRHVGGAIDHIDHDPLNNCKSNLRICNDIQNQGNARISKNNSSGFKGVTFRKDTQRWVAQICRNHKHVSLGCFSTAEDAARAYNKAAIEYFGEFALINFISEAAL